MLVRWSFELLDYQDRKKDMLRGVTGGHAEIVAQSPLGGSGALSFDVSDPSLVPDFMSDRVRATFHKGTESWPFGVFMFSQPKERHSEFGVVGYDITLLTKMNVVQEDALDARLVLPAGTPVVQAAVDLLTSTGETRIAVTPSPSVLAGPLTFEAATSKLEVINTLLTSIGYWALRCDRSGLFRIEPYTRPEDRPPAHEFEHGEASLHFPDWAREQDLTSVPNKVILIGSAASDEVPLVGIARDTDPASPFSYQNRAKGSQPGRWIPHKETGVEAESQAVIDQLAERKLRDLRDRVASLKVDHAMLPLEAHDLVGFTPEDGRRRLATVQRMRFNFDEFTDVQAEWREVG
ncbi:hypothetical protein [Microbacterium esteraromaticum]|uniref:hypothetical protein n=1 Tax=Microbacterium esteraromaticum TaxID=57043 RepID=UPI0019D3F072|nr:hypothetical protein [Microbacterium esteraromaticum]MBN7792438.1 hypothetical protein [Microbacterium esteraromaticum]